MNSGMSDLDRLAGTAKQVLANAHGLEGITGFKGYFPNLRGSDASNAQADLDSLKAMVSFGVLKDMRNTSKTGGALGNVSDAEGKRLEAALGSLANAQSVDQFKKRLQQIVDFSDQAKDRISNTYNMHYGTKDAPTASTPSNMQPTQQGVPQTGQVYKGHIFLGGDPSDPSRWKKQ